MPASDDLDAKEREKSAFLQLAERLANAEDTAELQNLKEDLARIIFGE